MSATNRGGKRVKADNYPTPPEAIEAFLDNVSLFNPFTENKFLEPCAGNGAIVRKLRQHYPESQICAIEIRPEEEESLYKSGADTVIIDDWLTQCQGNVPASAIISNPPFGLALDILEQCFRIRHYATDVIMLLRLGYMESDKRSDFWASHPLTQLYPLTHRPSFGATIRCECGWRDFMVHPVPDVVNCPRCGKPAKKTSSTDAAGYAWFVWSNWRPKNFEQI